MGELEHEIFDYVINHSYCLLCIYLFQTKAAMTVLTQEQFIEGYRKAQLIDVREQNEFDRGHIRGARNIPLTQLKQSINALRPDKPVYLYCQNTTRSSRQHRY